MKICYYNEEENNKIEGQRTPRSIKHKFNGLARPLVVASTF